MQGDCLKISTSSHHRREEISLSGQPVAFLQQDGAEVHRLEKIVQEGLGQRQRLTEAKNRVWTCCGL